MIATPRTKNGTHTKRRSISPSACSSTSTGSETTDSSVASVSTAQAKSQPIQAVQSEVPSETWTRNVRNGAYGTVIALIVVVFSFWLPFTLARAAAVKTYLPAFWKYDSKVSLFDNTGWTYGTDYFLAVCMLLLTLIIPKTSLYKSAGWKSAGLLACYMFSVTAGGLAHQFYTTNESRNSSSFRVLWTVCVGTVALASGFMGAAAGELVRLRRLSSLPDIADSFWVGYAMTITVMVALGCFSYQRPACDIFIVGITQFPSTVYVTATLALLEEKRPLPDTDTLWWRLAGASSFLMNAPLLPLYPVMVQYTDWSLAAVNTLLHSWLLVTWSIQGLSLGSVGYCINKEKVKQ